jgi:integrase/recombinase XerD
MSLNQLFPTPTKLVDCKASIALLPGSNGQLSMFRPERICLGLSPKLETPMRKPDGGSAEVINQIISSDTGTQIPAHKHDMLFAAQADALSQYGLLLAKRRYAERTSHNYTKALRQFFAFIAPLPPAELDHAAICAALAELSRSRGIAASYHNLLANAIRLYYEEVEGRPRLNCTAPRQKEKTVIPKVLTRDEVQRIFKATTYLKHKCLLALMYGTGMRLSELLALTRHDWDVRKRVMRVRKSPNPKPREIPVPASLFPLMEAYFQEYNPQTLLFEGREEGKPLGERSLQIILHQIAERAGITRNVTPNMLRHSYATHVLETGGSLQYLQEVLGHSSIRTTSVYTYTARMRKPGSPVDGMEF